MKPDFDFLSQFSGEPGQFWPQLNAYAKQAFRADAACLLLQAGEQEPRLLAQDAPTTAQQAVQRGVLQALGPAADTEHWFEVGLGTLALMVVVNQGTRVWLVVLDSATLEPDVAAREVRLLAESYFSRRKEVRSSAQVLSLTEVLDLGLELGRAEQFPEAATRLCHRVAGITRAARVCLGWRTGVDVKLHATSHGGRLSSDTAEADALARVMEEAADQNNEVCYPTAEGNTAICREHQSYSQAHRSMSVASIPLRDAERQVVGVLTVERAAEDGRLEPVELERLRMAADLVSSRLVDLHLSSGWWGKRAWRQTRHRAARLLGPENTGWKLGILGVLATLLALALIQVDHRVSSPFLLKTEAASVATAPFAGFLDQVHYHLGDVVKQGQVLLTLDRRELLLDEANGIAARDRNEREARNLEAQGKLAEALMAKAERRQDEAKLAIVQHRLGKTEVRSPFDGVVVEGDLRERLSSPVQVGEPLLKVVQLKDLYAQLQVDERDIGYLHPGMVGELAFASRPAETFSVTVERYEPVAEVRQEGNVFLLRVHLPAGAQDWWRPGMSGLCKITVSQRSLLWVLTHRTIETLRLWLWW